MSTTASPPLANAGPSTSKDEDTSKKVVKRRNSTSKSSRSREPTRQESFGGAVIRALFGTRPVRLFRPVKLSSWTILEAMAKREGRSLSLRYLRTLLRRENSNFLPHLPPLLFNTAIGFTLFEAYSITESRLLAKAKRKQRVLDGVEADEEIVGDGEDGKPKWTPLWIVTASGAVAGAAQCFLSAPLDNVRYIIQRNISGPDPYHRTGTVRPITTISWRAILRAAILPFAPAIARDKLVQDVQNETIERSKRAPKPTLRARLIALIEPATTSLKNARSGSGTVGERFTMSPEKRKEWEKRLKRWRGGVHGSGLALSLIRDSVGFGSFFFIFEVSRRCAFFASTGVDRVSAWFNARGLGIVRPAGAKEGGDGDSNVVGRRKGDDGLNDGGEMHIEDGRMAHWIREGQRNNPDADVSYNQSRTVQGRVVAVIILLVGGAVGAFSYELVGRPFELMRVVIWEGRKQWEQGKRKPGYRAAQTRAAARRPTPKEGEGSTGFTTLGRSAVKGPRASAAAQAEELGAKAFRRRPDFLVLRTENSSGTKVSRVLKTAKIPRPPHPLRLVAKNTLPSREVNGTAAPMLTSSLALQQRKAHKTLASASASESATPSHAGSATQPEMGKRTIGRNRRPAPSLATRPGFLTLLIEHAQSTAKLDRLHSGGLDPSKASIPLLLLHTYFIAPFLPEIPKPVLDNEIVRTAAGVDKHLRPSSSSSPLDSFSKNTIGDKISTVAQRTLLMSFASRRRTADSPEAKLKRNWIKNNPVNFSLASNGAGATTGVKTAEGRMAAQAGLKKGGFGASDRGTLQKGTRYWASGRVVWTLKRLATPYGVAFLVFAWLGGDLN